MMQLIESFDFSILDFIRHNIACEFLDILMPKITLLGELGIIWIAFAIIMITRKKYRKYGFMMLIGMLSGVIIGNFILKNLVMRPRPCWIEAVPLLIENPTDYSFPSGHTLASVIGAFIMTSANRKNGFFAIPLAALIAFSRLYLYVHFPTDVLASIILGIFISISVLRINKIIKNIQQQKRPPMV